MDTLRISIIILLTAFAISACAPQRTAPVEERGRARAGIAHQGIAKKHPRDHIVRRGETLYSIAFRYGLDWRRVANWNRIPAPFVIHPGDRIRLLASNSARRTTNRRSVNQPAPRTRSGASDASRAGSGQNTATQPAAKNTASRQPSPVNKIPPPTTAKAAAKKPQKAAPKKTHSPPPAVKKAAPRKSPPKPVAASRQSGNIAWRWPVSGRTLRRFKAGDAARQGIDIAGKLGDTIVAAAEGTVVYSGTGLIGYGELIIIKHNERLLSAYGHNRRRLVKEGDKVKAGQPISEMGRTAAGEVLLHFEVRVEGKPQNPVNYLPKR